MIALSVNYRRKETPLCAVLAAAVVLICVIYFSWKAGILVAGLLALEGCLQLRSAKPVVQLLLELLWAGACGAVVIASAVYTSGFLSGSHHFGRDLALNFLCIAIICTFLYILTASFRFSVIGATFLGMFLITANIFIFEFRGKELLFTDLMSFGTALNVAGQYTFMFPGYLVYPWFIWLAAAASCACLPGYAMPRGLRARLHALPVLMGACLVLHAGASGIRIRTWDREGTWINGCYLNFYLSIRDSFVQTPDSYQMEFLKEIEEDYAGQAQQLPAELPNIIVIMSESFADFGVFGAPLQTDVPVTPFLDSLEENTVRGYALTSVFGGNTANAEFEFLTGGTMAFLPTGSVAYQQYVTGNTACLPRWLEQMGYTTFATHPYLADGWSRTTVYPWLGLEDYSFQEAYGQTDLIRDYVSDRQMYRYVLEQLEIRGEDSPLFLFGITMQNHGGYDYAGEDFSDTVRLTGYEGDYPLAQQYFSLLHESDRALEELIAALSEYGEDTLLLFFGDHFPGVEPGLYTALHGGGFDTLDDQMLQYKVPFFIWANYDLPEQTIACTSLNYLTCHLLEAAGIPLPPYCRFLADLEGEIPAMNAMGYYSESRGAFIPFEEAEGREAVWLEKYRVLQYNHLFDPENRSDLFFGAADLP